MKTYLTYGVVMAIAGAVLFVALYLLGFHSDPAKLGTAQIIGGIGGLIISITCITLGIKARRAEIPATEEFGYGRAFGAGFMIVLFAAIIGIGTTFLYGKVINPNFSDVVVQAEIAKLEAKGATASQIEGAEKFIRAMSGPTAQAIVGFVFGIIFGTIISLIAAIFLKRRAVPQAFAAPPVV